MSENNLEPDATQSGEGSAEQVPEWVPSAKPWVIAGSVMLSTFMVVLDSSVANVALPHIAGSLSASTNESTWVLTSYLVSNAVMLPATGWLARRVGRCNLMLISIALFTVTSVLCGAAISMPMLIVARVLQGIGGGGMQPLAQAILLESFPLHKRGPAMAAYGVGVIVAPVIGPVLGGWITDSYSWRWIFYVNVPVGLLAYFLVRAYVEDPPYLRKRDSSRIDYVGFTLMALGLGALQLVLDKGQESDWFGSGWIIWGTVIAAGGLIAFVVWELSVAQPIVDLRVLGDRNFLVGTVIITLYGGVLYGITSSLPLFLQTVMGYSAYDSGMTVSPRGLGAMLGTILVGRLVGLLDNRMMLAVSFSLFAFTAFMFSGITLDIGAASVAWPNIFNGFAAGTVFVPLTMMTMATLENHEMGNATGIYNLMRNMGGSIGIATITTTLARRAQVHQNVLVQHITPYDAPVQNALNAASSAVANGGGGQLTSSSQQAVGLLYHQVQQQASLAAYLDVFQGLATAAGLCVLLVLLFHRRHYHPPQAAAKS